MFTHRPLRTGRSGRRVARGISRGAALGVLLVLSALAVPSFADEPVSWKPEPPVSGFDFLLVLLLIPLGIGLVIALMVVLPSLVKGEGYDPTRAWVGMHNEWFGGPQRNVDEPARTKAADTGGASADW
ncbi:MAG: hypothetical protein ACRDPH_01810 [Marmoricola sp.]